MGHDVFISYSTVDQKIVEGMTAFLEQDGIRCFVAYRDIPKGVVWAKAITEAIEQSKLMVVVFSEHFNRSCQIEREIEICIKREKPILFFIIEDGGYIETKKNYLKNRNWIIAFPNPEEYFGNIKAMFLRIDKDDFGVKLCSVYEFNYVDFLYYEIQKELEHENSLKEECGNLLSIPSDMEIVISSHKMIEENRRKYKIQNIKSECNNQSGTSHALPKEPRIKKWLNNIFHRKYPNHNKQNHLSIFAPSQLIRGENMLVQVYLHQEKFLKDIKSKSGIRDKNSTMRANEVLDTKLQYGDVVELKLFMPKEIQVIEPIQKIVWRDDLRAIDFEISTPDSCKLGDMIGTVTVCKDSLPICSVKFVTKIVSQIKEKISNAKTYPIYYKNVFVSYSSKDRDEVIKITTGFKALHIDFFLDKFYLEGGDKYKEKIFRYIDSADLFLLCWSLNAAESEWVKKEYLYAMERINREDMSLTIYPLIIEPKAIPPKELEDYHFVEL